MTKRKNKKLLVATLLAVPAAVVVADDMQVSAETGVQEGTVVVPGDYPQVQTTSLSPSSIPTLQVTDETSLKTALQSQMENFKSKVVIEYKKTGGQTVGNADEIYTLVNGAITGIFTGLYGTNQSLKGIFNGYKYTYTYQGNVATIQLEMNYLTGSTDNSIAENMIYSQFSGYSNKSTLEKLKAAHDYIIKLGNYSNTMQSNKSPHAVYTLLTTGKGSEHAYSLLAYKAAKIMGVDVRHVTGRLNGSLHSWNVVKMDDNNWYLWDVLSDEFLSTATNNNKGKISYKNFVMPISNNYEGDLDTSITISTANTYNAPFQAFDMAIQVNSVLYYSNLQDNKLSKMDLATNTSGPIHVNPSDLQVKYVQHFNGWLYFINLADQNIYKIKLDGTDLTSITTEAVTELQIIEGELKYKTTNGLTKSMVLNGSTDEVVEAVKEMINALDAGSTALEIIKARLTFDALTEQQKTNVGNISNITNIEVTDFYTGPNLVMKRIEELNIYLPNYRDLISKIDDLIDNLTAGQKEKIENIQKLNTIKGQVNIDETTVANWQTKVENLTTNLSYEGVENARAQYEAMTTAQKNRDTNTGNFNSKLTNLELEVKTQKVQAQKVKYDISVLSDSSKTFITDTEAAKQAFGSLNDIQKAYIGISEYSAAVDKATEHKVRAITFLDKVYYWGDPVPITKIEQARIEFYNFVPAVRGYIETKGINYKPEDESETGSSDLIYKLKLNVHLYAGLDPVVIEVCKLIEKLDSENIIESDYRKANETYNTLKTEAFDKQPQVPSHLVTKLNDIAQDINDSKTASENWNNLAIKLTDDNYTTHLLKLKNEYEALTTYGKSLIEAPAKAKYDLYIAKLAALAVIDEIDNLVVTNETAVNTARANFEALSAEGKGYVTNIGKLELAEANLVSKEIMRVLTDSNPTSPALTAFNYLRTKFNTLKEGAKKEVSEEAINRLESYEAAYVDNEISKLTEISTIAGVNAVRVLVDALTGGARGKLKNLQELERIENIIVNPNERIAAKAVDDEILRLYAKIATVTSAELNILLKMYEDLAVIAQGYVKEKDKLTELKTAVEAKEIDIEKAKKEADPVIKLINALKSSSSAEDLKKARDAYTALSPAAQKVVQDGDVLKKLEDFEKALEDKEKEAAEKEADDKARAEAREVEIKINAISETSTLEEVKAADAAYTALSDTAKKFVSASAKTKLESLLAAKEKEYKETHGKAEAEAKDVSDRIDKITTATTVKELQSIRRAYEALSELAKTYVKNLAKLTSYEVSQEQQAKIVAAAKNEAAAFDTYMADLNRNSTTAEIAKARAFYNNLSAEAKKHSKTLEKLIKLETMWSDPDYIDLYLNYYPHYTDQQPTGGIEITASKPDPLFIPDSVATTNAGPGEIAMDYRDGNYTATVFATDAPGSTKSKLTLTSSNNVKVSLPKKDILALKKLPVTVSTAVGYKSVTISFTEGYTAKTFSDFVEIKVPISELGANSKSVILCKLPNGQYEKATYQVLDGAFVIKTKVGATFVVEDKSATAPTTTASTGYKDINSSANSKYINELVKLGIVSGGTASNYYPSQNITRGDFAIMIARAANLTTSTTTSLTDVRNTSNASLIEALNELGIMRGTTSTRFNMSGTVTREEASVILARLFRHLKMDVATMQNEQQTNYRDIANLSYESRRSIALMNLLEIFDDVSATAFNPTAKLTRGEFAKVLSKAMEAAELK